MLGDRSGADWALSLRGFLRWIDPCGMLLRTRCGAAMQAPFSAPSSTHVVYSANRWSERRLLFTRRLRGLSRGKNQNRI